MLKSLPIVIILLFLQLTKATSSSEDNQSRTLSISFVFDTTSSMGDVLQQMRKSASKIFEKIEKTEMADVNFNYVLVLFNDPNITEVFITDNKEDFLDKLWDIQVYGGGDCPENSLTGLSRAIEESSYGAHIFLFTDADSKEKEVSNYLKSLLSFKKPKLYFVLTGKCFSDYDPVYEKLANITQGHLFIVPESEVEDLLNKFVENLSSYEPPSDGPVPENLAVLPLPRTTTKTSLVLKIDQFPDKVYEYDEFTLHCSAVLAAGDGGSMTSNTGVVLTLMRDNVTLTQKLSSAKLNNSNQVMVVAFNVQKARLNDTGMYVCKARQAGAGNVANKMSQLILTVHKRQVRQRKELTPIHEGKSKDFFCNLVSGSESLKWERNHLILNQTLQSLHLNAVDVLHTHQLACFTLHRNANLVDEIIFDILIGAKPQVNIEIESKTGKLLLNENKKVLNCFAYGQLVTYFQLFGHDNRIIFDSSRHGGLEKVSNNTYRITKDVEMDKLHGDTQFTCLAYSFFGVGSKSITVEANEVTTRHHRHPGRLNPEMLVQKPPDRVSLQDSYGPWTQWSPCSGSCGTGHRSRYRKCTKVSKSCTSTLYEVEVCHLPACSDLYRRRPNERSIDSPKNTEAWMGRRFEHDQFFDYSKNELTSCPSGYSWDLLKQVCVDVDECNRKGVCPRSHRCVNRSGSFQCLKCPNGFAGVKSRCLDINECSQGKHNCSQICVNLPGGYICKCQRYYELQSDGVSCNPTVF